MNKRSQELSNLSSDGVDKEEVNALPKCSVDTETVGTEITGWSGCIGTSIHPRFGNKYVYKWNNGKRNRHNTMTYVSAGHKYIGEWVDHGSQGEITYGRLSKRFPHYF